MTGVRLRFNKKNKMHTVCDVTMDGLWDSYKKRKLRTSRFRTHFSPSPLNYSTSSLIPEKLNISAIYVAIMQ